MDPNKQVVPSSTKTVSQVIRLVKESLKKSLNYLQTEEFKKAVELAKSCKDINMICVFSPRWIEDDILAVGLFHTRNLAYSYARKNTKIQITDTQNL